MYRKLLPWYIDQKNSLVCIKKSDNISFLEDKITLLNWNVHKNNHSTKWLLDFQYILDYYSPNIITFQEYKTKSRRSILDSHKDYNYGFLPNINIYEEDYGLVNASTSNISEFSYIFSEHVEPLIKTPKISFLTQYKLKNSQKLTIINTHMINFVKIKKYISQINQLENLSTNHNTLILTGDFNTWSIKRMNILKSMTKSLGLEHVTFEIDHHKKRYLSHPLDHVFYKGVRPIKTEILQQFKTSDHKPIVVDFAL
jgi:endonuclease/exonuclease/phosphatase (EEP) superfamily protein YafD